MSCLCLTFLLSIPHGAMVSSVTCECGLFFVFLNVFSVCDLAMPLHGRIQRGEQGVRTPEKSQNIGFLSNTGPDQASVQCWTIIDTPAKRHLTAKRHLNGVSLAYI